MTPDVRHAEVPTGSAWRSGWPTQPRPMNAGMFSLVTLPTSPFWARRYTRKFLNSCRGITEDTAQTAELVVSELVTNSVRYSNDATRPEWYPERVKVNLISLSIRHFSDRLLIEVFDTDSNPPMLAHSDTLVESSRGLVIVDALAKEWSFFYLPDGGKVVYCVLEIS